jgi:hypothetical protein
MRYIYRYEIGPVWTELTIVTAGRTACSGDRRSGTVNEHLGLDTIPVRVWQRVKVETPEAVGVANAGPRTDPHVPCGPLEYPSIQDNRENRTPCRRGRSSGSVHQTGSAGHRRAGCRRALRRGQEYQFQDFRGRRDGARFKRRRCVHVMGSHMQRWIVEPAGRRTCAWCFWR